MMEVKLIGDSFELKQNQYDCNSTFVCILAKAGSEFDREELGENILDYDEWGCIDPPGPNAGFGGPIDPDFIEENWDDELRAKLTIDLLKSKGELSGLAEQIFPCMDGLFFANTQESHFQELPHQIESLINFLASANGDDYIEIVEYEDG